MGTVEAVFVIFMALFGLASAIIADYRGENKALWFLLGALLGPIGVVLSLFICGKRCSYCQSKIPEKASICPKCKSPLEA